MSLIAADPFPALRAASRGRRPSVTRLACAAMSAVTIGAVAFMLGLFAWQSIPVWRHAATGYITGTQWHYPTALFGSLSMIYGTVVVSTIAILLAAPIGIAAAVFTAELLPGKFRLAVKLVVELLAGIPSVVYGLLGILYLRNFVYDGLARFDPLSGDTLLTAGILLAVMILPTVMTLSDDALRGVPAQQRHAARALGLSRVQAVWRIALPQARVGLLAAVLLALGRALGETIAVFLVIGRQDGQFPANLFSLAPLLEAGQTLTTKLGGPEVNIAYGAPLHWAAIVGLGLILMLMVGAITLAGAWLETRREPKPDSLPAGVAQTVGMLPDPQDATSKASTIWRPPPLAKARRRCILGAAFVGACALAAIASAGILVAIVAAILYRGGSALNWKFLTEQIRLVGADGGIFFNLVGTLILITAALAVALPISTGLAIMHGVYLRTPAGKRRLGLVLYTLNGMPSILFGLLGLIVFVKFLGWGKSWLAGGILLGMMILPTITVALIERIKALPAKYVEAGRGLGLSESQAVWSIILPQCRAGLITGSLLGLARAAGETAPIMFTATIFAGATIPRGIKESPVLSLPYHIFILAQDSFDPRVGGKLWGAAAVLLCLVLLLALVALPMRLRSHEEAAYA